MKINLLERLQAGPIIIDGSLEAVLRSQGYNENPIEIYNLKNPLLIEKIIGEFIDAGAEIVQTNTRSANALSLAPYKLDDKVYEINRKGVWLARTAAVNRAYVAGVVGPVGKFLAPIGTLTHEHVREAFMAQIHALVDGNCDLLLLKSFIDIEELEIAMDVARHISHEMPIIAQKTFPEDGSVLATDYPREIAKRLNQPGVIAIGSNGTVGPQRMQRIARALYSASSSDSILSAQPDIGTPTMVDGQPVYNATTEYVAQSVKTLVENGITIVGADGGGMPEHVRAIREAIKGMPVGKPEVKVKTPKAEQNGTVKETTPSRFSSGIGKRFLVSVEVGIPRGLDMTDVLDEAEYMKEQGVDAINIFDGARARLRISPIAISRMIQEHIGIECITHLACRDRNMVGLQSDLLGAHTLGLRNILAVTGDPTHIGDYPYATSVYDIDSIGLIRTLKRMNEGLDLVGNPIGEHTNFLITCACNPIAEDMDREVSRLERKAVEGAEVAFTQPIFDRAALELFLQRIEHIPIKIMVGISLLSGTRHAEFLHHEVPGMTIPDAIQDRLKKAESPAQEGVDIAVEFVQSLDPMPEKVVGLYIMPPGKKYHMVADLLERTGLRKEAAHADR